MDIKFVLTIMGLVYGPVIVIVGILYLFNRRIRAKRILQVESENVNETVLFAGNRLLSTIYIMGSLPATPLVPVLLFTYGIDFEYKDMLNIIYLAMGVVFVLALYVAIKAYKKIPMPIFTMRKLYLFPRYGRSPIPQTYDLDALRWTEERVEKGTLIRLYAGEELLCHTQGMPKGVDDFVREHVKPKEA